MSGTSISLTSDDSKIYLVTDNVPRTREGNVFSYAGVLFSDALGQGSSPPSTNGQPARISQEGLPTPDEGPIIKNWPGRTKPGRS